MMMIGAVGPITINPLELLGKRAAVRGWYSGTGVEFGGYAGVQPTQQHRLDERDLSVR